LFLLLCCFVALLLWFCFVLFCVCNMQVDFMRRLEEDITIKNIARICLHAMKNSSDFNFTSCVGFNLSIDRSHLLGEPIDGMRIIFALSKRGLARLKSQRKNEKRLVASGGKTKLRDCGYCIELSLSLSFLSLSLYYYD
jgi:hypothetical protein